MVYGKNNQNLYVVPIDPTLNENQQSSYLSQEPQESQEPETLPQESKSTNKSPKIREYGEPSTSSQITQNNTLRKFNRNTQQSSSQQKTSTTKRKENNTTTQKQYSNNSKWERIARSYGFSGMDEVKSYQIASNKKLGTRLLVDGKIGNNTKRALRRFSRKQFLSYTNSQSNQDKTNFNQIKQNNSTQDNQKKNNPSQKRTTSNQNNQKNNSTTVSNQQKISYTDPTFTDYNLPEDPSYYGWYSTEAGIQEILQCAEWFNNEMGNYSGKKTVGDAWTGLAINSDRDKIISGFQGMNQEAGSTSERNQNNIQAARNWSKMINVLEDLDPTQIYQVSMAVNRSGSTDEAYNKGINLGDKGKITSTHTGALYYDGNQWLVADNVHGKVSVTPLKNYITNGGMFTVNGVQKGITASGPVRQVNQDIALKDKPDSSLQDIINSSIGSYNAFGNTKGSDPRVVDIQIGWQSFANNHDGYNDYADLVIDLVKNGFTQNYINGTNLTGLERSDKINTYANISSPIVNVAYETTRRPEVINAIQETFNISPKFIDMLRPLVVPLLWKESNGGSNFSIDPVTKEEKKNTKYSNEHISQFGNFGRHFVNSITNKPTSEGMGSVKVSEKPLSFRFTTKRYSGNDARLLEDVISAGPNVLANLAYNFTNLLSLFSDDAYLLFDGNMYTLSNLGKALLFEAHNQGTHRGIAASYYAYKHDGNINHLLQFVNPTKYGLAKNPKDNPSYGATVLGTYNQAFVNPGAKTLNEVVVTPESYEKNYFAGKINTEVMIDPNQTIKVRSTDKKRKRKR